MKKHNEKWNKIKESIQSGKPMKEIAKEFQVSYSYVTLVGRELKFWKEKEMESKSSSSKII